MPDWLQGLTKNKLAFHKAFRLLCSHGPVAADSPTASRQVESQGYSMHGCVHSWIIHGLSPEFDM